MRSSARPARTARGASLNGVCSTDLGLVVARPWAARRYRRRFWNRWPGRAGTFRPRPVERRVFALGGRDELLLPEAARGLDPDPFGAVAVGPRRSAIHRATTPDCRPAPGSNVNRVVVPRAGSIIQMSRLAPSLSRRRIAMRLPSGDSAGARGSRRAPRPRPSSRPLRSSHTSRLRIVPVARYTSTPLSEIVKFACALPGTGRSSATGNGSPSSFRLRALKRWASSVRSRANSR